MKIPLDRGILNVQCPHCAYTFPFDPIDYLNTLEAPTHPTLPSSNSQNPKSRLISILLFTILGLYIARGITNCKQDEFPKIQNSPFFGIDPFEPDLEDPFPSDIQPEEESPYSI